MRTTEPWRVGTRPISVALPTLLMCVTLLTFSSNNGRFLWIMGWRSPNCSLIFSPVSILRLIGGIYICTSLRFVLLFAKVPAYFLAQHLPCFVQCRRDNHGEGCWRELAFLGRVPAAVGLDRKHHFGSTEP